MIKTTYLEAELFQLAEPAAITDTAATELTAKRAFKMVAYTGRPVSLNLGGKFVFDLSGLKMPEKQIPVLYGHDAEKIAGYADMVYNAANGLEAAGSLIIGYPDGSANPYATLIANNADAGLKWQCSIGARLFSDPERLNSGVETDVNGFRISGPAFIAKDWTVSEISFCALGADSQTSAAILKEAGNIKGDIMDSELTEKIAVLEEKLRAADLALAASELETLEARHDLQLSDGLRADLCQNFDSSQIKVCFRLADELMNAKADKGAVKENDREFSPKAAGNELRLAAELLKKVRPDLLEKDAATAEEEQAADNPLASATLKAAQKTAEAYNLAAGGKK